MFTLLTLNIMLSLIIGYLGRHRKLGFWGLFFGSMFLTPLIGLVILLASGDVSAAPNSPSHK
jgi:uncharacterized membrane protein